MFSHLWDNVNEFTDLNPSRSLSMNTFKCDEVPNTVHCGSQYLALFNDFSFLLISTKCIHNAFCLSPCNSFNPQALFELLLNQISKLSLRN